ncbi:PAS domain S-box protein [uncultured Piscinibacter sp.]|uniref:PAS domain-containing hybrid sensor histidine kinase/response regulator n=1 Tax=uncultured Piscinibacter sp. TaxID=1131835 RepID=UPI002611C333|nr:PAS domain S-box protein [uncultured Piscinibacter sp.]
MPPDTPPRDLAASATRLEAQLAALRRIALAVAQPGGEAPFEMLVGELVEALQVDTAFVAVFADDTRQTLRTLAARLDDRPLACFDYPLEGSPCAKVVGRDFRYVARGVSAEFRPGTMFAAKGMDSYAAYPLHGGEGAPLGLLVAMDREAIAEGDAGHAEAILKVVAVRAAAEIERLAAGEALRRSEASYRAIFAAAEDAVFIHDWDSGAILDANPKACETYGCSRDELRRLSLADISNGAPPCAGADAAHWMALARQGRCPPYERSRRSQDGSLHWDEVRLKPATINGRPHLLAFTRDITERKGAIGALQAREAQYRAIFDGSADALALWNRELRIVDINRAFTRMFGYRPDEVVGASFPRSIGAEAVARRTALLRAALAGDEGVMETEAVRKDGSRFEIELRYLPIRYADSPHVLAIGRDITERRERERALERSEAQYRGIFNASADALVLRAADFSIVDVNATYEQMSGYRREEVIGIDRVLANPPETEATIRGLHAQALAGEPIALRTQLVRRDGLRYELELRGVPVEHGGRPHVLYMGRDITQAMQAEQALRDSEAQYRAIFNASADALMLWNSQLLRVDVNSAHEQIFGFTRDDVVGKAFESLPYPDEFVQPRMDMLRRALAGEASRAELEALRKDGRRIVTELRTVPIRHRGEPHVLQIARDITERLDREQALQRSEARLRATVEAAFDAVIGMDGEGRVVEFNAAAERIFGHRREQVLGRSLAALILPERHRAAHERGLKHFPATGRGPMVGRLVETTAVTADGREIPIELAISVAAVPEGSIFVGHLRDISARRAAEAERAALEAQLRQAQKMEAIGQLTGGIAHDFNNILTSVIGYLVMGQERAESLADATLSRQLGQAQLAAQRARELIAQMLAFARRRPSRRQPLALAPLLRQSVQLLRATLPSSIVLDAVELGAADDEAMPQVEGDAVQLEQVLFNLCINARDAMDGAGRIRIGLREASGGWHCRSCGERIDGGRWVELSVTDDGAGIGADVMPRMFDPFYSTKEVGKGSGMGLAMVHGIVHDHRGHICVDSVPGHGARFRVLLPSADGASAQGTVVAAAPEPVHRRLAGRVLLVEDETLVGDYLAEQLRHWGLAVTLHRDPHTALDWLAQDALRTDLLITDYTMPQMTGLQLARQATRLRAGLPVLLVSGNADGFDAAVLADNGVRAALPKPIDVERLRALLHETLAVRH